MAAAIVKTRRRATAADCGASRTRGGVGGLVRKSCRVGAHAAVVAVLSVVRTLGASLKEFASFQRILVADFGYQRI